MSDSPPPFVLGAGDLVGLDVASAERFVEVMTQCWEAGAAVLPIDQRLPAKLRQALVDELAPTALVSERGWDRRAAGIPVEPGDRLVMTTSGTSGTPKGVVLTEEALRAAAVATSKALNVDPSVDCWLCCLPTAHMGGLGVVTRSLFTDTPLVVHDGFDAAAVTAATSEGVTLVSLVATAMRRIDPRIFRTILLGGAAIPPDKPENAVATYGLTESCGGVVYDGYPIEGVEMRLGEGDEIQLRGPMMMRGYRNPTDAPPFTDDGWLRTGDRGAISHGVLQVFGRMGDLIITGGENVWPAPVEALLQAQPWAKAVVVVGRPDPEWGQAVTAIIEPETGATVPTLDQVRDLVKEQLPAFCAPRALEFRTLPLTALGKVRRQDVR